MTVTNTGEQRYQIQGMDCASCAATLEKGVSQLDGVQLSSVSFATEVLRVQGNVDPQAIVARVRELGYDVRDSDGPKTAGMQPQGAGFLAFMLERWDTRLALAGALLILPGLLFNELLPGLGWDHPLLDVTSVLAMAVAGWPVARSAWRSLRINREININVLMTIASIGALAIGAVTEAGLVMVLFAIGEALEGYTAQRARGAIRSLMEIAPAEATRLHQCADCAEHLGQGGYEGGPCPYCPPSEQRVPVEMLTIGDEILVKPGERIPMDGLVVAGWSAVNQAPVTGESMPIAKEIGDEVFAGTINGLGVLTVSVTHLAADNTISRIIQMVEEAQEKRAPAQRFVDRFARVYTPAVVVLAALVAIVPPLLFDQPFLSAEAPTAGWLYRGLALLVVACPCALVISTPVSLISAISNAARHGVLFKGGIFLEAMAKVAAVALDKTGTLTEGRPQVTGVQCAACDGASDDSCPTCDDLLALAAAVEQHSEHPLAQALVEEAARRNLANRYAPRDVQALVGQGVQGWVDGRRVTIGSHAYFDDSIAHPREHHSAMERAASQGHTPLLVSEDGRYQGYITVADAVRPSGKRAVSLLHQAGVRHLVMLTGDAPPTAARIAQEAGLETYRAGLMPGDKAAAVEALRETYGTVAMVGDGINDAPALAAADIGVAMGTAGSAQALETADVALLNDDLSRLPYAVALSKATMRNIRTNIGLSLGIKGVFLLLVLMGAGTMWMAVFADMGASLLVTLNGMRLLRRPVPAANAV
jgi:Cd2+/Zn2+-exporting ATPase